MRTFIDIFSVWINWSLIILIHPNFYILEICVFIFSTMTSLCNRCEKNIEDNDAFAECVSWNIIYYTKKVPVLRKKEVLHAKTANASNYSMQFAFKRKTMPRLKNKNKFWHCFTKCNNNKHRICRRPLNKNWAHWKVKLWWTTHQTATMLK